MNIFKKAFKPTDIDVKIKSLFDDKNWKKIIFFY
jgi:hypothetical protein